MRACIYEHMLGAFQCKGEHIFSQAGRVATSHGYGLYSRFCGEELVVKMGFHSGVARNKVRWIVFMCRGYIGRDWLRAEDTNMGE